MASCKIASMARKIYPWLSISWQYSWLIIPQYLNYLLTISLLLLWHCCIPYFSLGLNIYLVISHAEVDLQNIHHQTPPFILPQGDWLVNPKKADFRPSVTLVRPVDPQNILNIDTYHHFVNYSQIIYWFHTTLSTRVLLRQGGV